ncbi:MFS transporter [Gordonia humi]|uniref:DHA2 family methylenomycin A resistance protein-like MFS transporter n=1 Tax=Gordonia humi TaxID=686429 RepID=A0A840F1E8_9ACTN|nr:DHA2 family methylenomycin A resistance protein-like MFS transporter [Gordonia humi]
MNRSTTPTAVHRGSPLLLTVLCAPMFLVLLDVLAMNVAMPSLGRAYAIGRDQWSLLVGAYTVPLAVGLLPAGWLVDRIGPRRVLLGGLLVFAAASMLGAVGWAWSAVLAARLLQGLAAAAMLPAGLAALTTTWTDPAPRARTLGIWSGVSAVATAIGPGAGGGLVAAFDWRAVFWIDIPLVLVAVIGTRRLLPERRARSEHGRPTGPRSLAASVVAAAIMTSGANGTLQVVTVHMQDDLHLAPGPAGTLLLVGTAPFVILGPMSGRLVAARGRRAVAASGFVAGAVGLATLGRVSGLVGLVPGLLGIGVGLGLMTAAIVGETMAAWPARPGLAGGLNNALRQVGTSAGVAVGAGLTSGLGDDALLTRTGSVAGLWWLCGALVVVLGFSRPGTPRGAPMHDR